jgi:tetratricopeptide (TPR) repeat protein
LAVSEIRGLHTAEEADVREALRAEVTRLRGADPFQALRCDYDADAKATRAAYLRAIKAWHPNRFARRGPDIRDLATEVFVAIRKAWDAIGDDEARAQTLKRLGKHAPAHSSRHRMATPPVGTPRHRGTATPPAGTPRHRGTATPPAGTPRQRGTATPPAGTPRPRIPRRRIPRGRTGSDTDVPFGTDTPAYTESDSQMFERGRALMDQERYDAARMVFDRLTQRDPSSKRFQVHFHYTTGCAHQAKNRTDLAKEAYERALALDPDFARAKTALESVTPKTKQRGLFSKLFRK